MPRQAHGRPLLVNGPSKARKSKPKRGRGLNALETAEREYPENIKVRQHRLGEVEDDSDDANARTHSVERSAKRRKIDSTTEDVLSEDQGSDPDGHPWHVGVDEEDDDSDIDSDEAFGESDEDRFADFTFRGSQKNAKAAPPPKKSRQKALELDEDKGQSNSEDDEGYRDDEQDSENESLGEDAVDLAAAWDIDDEAEQRASMPRTQKSSMKKSKHRLSPAASSDLSELSESDHGSENSDDSGNEEENEDYGEYSEIDISEDETNDETTARLRNFVDGLTPVQQDLSKSRTSPKVLSKQAKSSSSSFPTRISAADLMKYVKDPAQRQSLKILQAAEREGPTNQKGGIQGKLSAPLAKRQQDRLDRVAAYEQTRQTLDRWVDTVKQNRRDEHISFPQTDPTKASASAITSFQAGLKTAPQSDLEAKIQEIMHESGFDTRNGNIAEREEQNYEELKEKRIPLEEVQARRRELRMQRELMFREEVKAKRIKKIKSKAYRRVHRKEKDKFAAHEHERLAAAGVLDSEEEREKNDRRRAEERMGARHRESKWAKAAKATGQTTWNDDAKIGVSELARRDEELRRRIEGKIIRGSDGSGSETGSESVDDSDSDAENTKWVQKLNRLDKALPATGKSKLADMAFMKKAEAERKAQNEEGIRNLRQALNGDESLSENGSDEEAVKKQTYGKLNRKKHRSIVQHTDRNEFEERLSEDEEAEQPDTDPTSNQQDPRVSGLSVAHNAQTGDLPTNRSPSSGKVAGSRTQDVKTLKPSQPKPRSASQIANLQSPKLEDYTSSSGSEDEQQDTLDDKDRLALEIFAGDDEDELRKQFDKEKKQTIVDEGDQVIDNTLPGWGNWVGAGVSKREQKNAKGRFTTVVKGVAFEARKDANLDRVIVNEKRVKKNSKYLATELPHPFESRQQYERSLRLPMGPEWSTRKHFQDAIKPRVLLKQGQIVKPLSKPIA